MLSDLENQSGISLDDRVLEVLEDAPPTAPPTAPLRGRRPFDNSAMAGELLVLETAPLADAAPFDFLDFGSTAGGPALPLFLVWRTGGGGVGLHGADAGALEGLGLGNGERWSGGGVARD